MEGKHSRISGFASTYYILPDARPAMSSLKSIASICLQHDCRTCWRRRETWPSVPFPDGDIRNMFCIDCKASSHRWVAVSPSPLHPPCDPCIKINTQHDIVGGRVRQNSKLSTKFQVNEAAEDLLVSACKVLPFNQIRQCRYLNPIAGTFFYSYWMFL